MKFRLPDRHDALILIGLLLVVGGVYQVMPWLSMVIAGLGIAYIGIAGDSAADPNAERE